MSYVVHGMWPVQPGNGHKYIINHFLYKVSAEPSVIYIEDIQCCFVERKKPL